MGPLLPNQPFLNETPAQIRDRIFKMPDVPDPIQQALAKRQALEAMATPSGNPSSELLSPYELFQRRAAARLNDPKVPVKEKTKLLDDLDEKEANVVRRLRKRDEEEVNEEKESQKELADFNKRAAKRGIGPLVDPVQVASSETTGAEGTSSQAPEASSTSTAPEKPTNAAVTELANPTKASPAGTPTASDPFGHQLRGADLAYQVGAERGRQKAAELTTLQAELDQKESERLEKQRIQDEIVDKKMSELEAMQEDYAKNSKVNPNRLYQESSTGNKILAGLSIAFGRLGAGLQGRERNSALEIINSAIENDIQAQKDTIAAKKGAIDSQMNVLAQTRSVFADERSADNAARMVLIDNTNRKIDMMIAKTADQEARANFEMLKGQLLEKRDKFNMEIAKDQSMIAKNLVDATGSEKLRPMSVPIGNGQVGYAYSATAAEKLRELKATVDSSSDSIQNLLKLTEKSGKSLSPELRRQAEVEAGMLRGALRVPITGPGALNESEIKLLDSIIANPTKIFSLDSSTKAALEKLRSGLENKFVRSAQSEGIDIKSYSTSRNDNAAIIAEAQARLAKDPNDKIAKEALQFAGAQ